MISSRGILILEKLLKDKENQNLKDLVEYFDLGERTIRYEIEKLMEEINEVENIIEISRGNITINNREVSKKFLENNYSVKVFSSEERELYILFKILFFRIINQSEVMEEMDISRSTIKIHLKNIKNILDKYHLTLESCHKKGLKLVGEEENIRSLLLKTITSIKKQGNIFFKKILDNYLALDEDGIKIFINYCQKLMEKIISDEAYEIIKNYIIIMILMIRNKNEIDKIKNEKFLENTKEYEYVNRGGTLLEAHYEINISKMEFLKITDYFLGSHTYNVSYSYYENWVEMEILVTKLINEFNKRIEVDISRDEILIDGLLNHLKPTIYRINNNIELENSIYEEVLESYPHLYKITSDVVKQLEDYIGNKFTEDEIAFLSIHFKAAIDRNKVKSKNKKNVLIVCGLGYGTSKLLSQKLREIYSIEIVDIIPKHFLKKTLKENENIDCIITSLDLSEENIDREIIRVHPILIEEDIKKLDKSGISRRNKKILFSKLMDTIKKYSIITEEEKLLEELKDILEINLVDDISPKKLTIFDMLDKNSIVRMEKISSWEEGIKIAGNILMEKGAIKETYIDGMIETIKKYGSYMVLAPGIVFPHARTEENVIKSSFGILQLDEGVLFPGNKLIKTIVAFSSRDNKEHIEAFVEIVEIFNGQNFSMDNFINKIQ
ncbi:Transcriptional antiterminator [Cetobacterium ceti]|uniref:Transcriptional antiterminator n=1 Tax=Cetobacterium ceti TaxID=180163 RepID=A0A1T4K790_9FUSO|nr:BglG family transcription antiterminator [Cetobacterium ceti]SJZ38183.1 Transcriptional antiterminator [Cetobacterium ceti]